MATPDFRVGVGWPNWYVNSTTSVVEYQLGLGGAPYTLAQAWSSSLLQPANLNVDANGNLLTNAINGLGLPKYDAVSLAQTTLTDIYTFYTGGLSGTLVATITLTYTDATKATIANVVRT